MPFDNLYTFNEAHEELKLRLGNRSDLGEGTADRLSQWLNSAQMRIAGCFIEAPDIDILGFEMLTVEDQSEYGLLEILPPATNIVGIKAIRNNGATDVDSDEAIQVKVRRFPWMEYRSISQQAPGPPMRWARWGYTLALDPKPDNVYSLLIDYRRLPTKDTTEIPVVFQEDWLHLAESMGWQALMKSDRSQNAFARISANIQMYLSQNMDWQSWDSLWDVDQVIAPYGFSWPYTVG